MKTMSGDDKRRKSSLKPTKISYEGSPDSSQKNLEANLKEGSSSKKHVVLFKEEPDSSPRKHRRSKRFSSQKHVTMSEEEEQDSSPQKEETILKERSSPGNHHISEEVWRESLKTDPDKMSEEEEPDSSPRKLETLLKEGFYPRKHQMISEEERPVSSKTDPEEMSEEESPDSSRMKLETIFKEGFSPSKDETISEKEIPDSWKLESIPPEERSNVIDTISRPSMSASRPPEVRFERERREMSVSPARKTITDHSQETEPITVSERSDLTAVIARKTLTPIAPLSMKERRELMKPVSILENEPETPLWFSEEMENTNEEGAEKSEEEPESLEEQPMHRAPELTMSRFVPSAENTPKPPTFHRFESSRLARFPSKRVFPTPNLKDDEVSNPFSKKERKALIRSLSISVTSSAAGPLWNKDSPDMSDSEDVRPKDEERKKIPLLPPELGEIKKRKIPKSTKRRRKVRVHVTDLARSHAVDSLEFCSNKVTSAKYSVSTFLPMNLFLQCYRAANLYFILIAALQLIPGFSPTNWATTLAPLAVVLLLNATKEAYDDFKRALSDRTINKQEVDVLNEGQFLPMHWGSLVVGDIVRVKRDHEFPADLVFLSSSDPKGLAYIETSNLDGEPSLKVRNAFYKGTQASAEEEDASALSIFSGLLIECEVPNNRLYKFDGAINLQDYGKLPLDIRQILLRGATLRNTDWILGVVVYTGADTKFVRNMIPGQHKVTELEKNVNILVALVFLCEVALCLGLAVGQDTWARRNPKVFYIPYDIFKEQVAVVPSQIGAQFGRFLILLEQMIPISLYVTLEVVKLVQSYFLDNDLQMYHDATKTFARSRTTNLNEELGQVQYVMTDKTGTLTQNVMAFVQFSVTGEVYGNTTRVTKVPEGSKTKCSTHTVTQDGKLQGVLKQIAEGSKEAAIMSCHSFLSQLAICNVMQPVLISSGEDKKESIAAHVDEESIRYIGPSPDEEALVQGAADCGYRLMKRERDELQIEMPGLGLQKFAILATLEFTSERKRMSIICRDSKGRIKLYCKGADTVLFKRLGRDQDDIIESTLKQLEEFARYGFRTLTMAQREISNAEYEQWADQFRNASVALDDRDEKVAAVAEEIERDLKLLGATAVEDKLQAGVPETVTILALAGIKIWVLTGDKLETSVSVGLACNLLADSMHLFLISDSVQKSVPQMLRSMLDEARRQQRSKLKNEGSYHSDMATVIEGNSLSVALEDRNKLVFLELCQLCRSVICCRVSPIQKAQVTTLVKEHGQGVVLAVGDGANDVGMLKVAQIGVGIGGREGMAAVLASDYAISRFRHLRRLLLVHGRWSYKRNREVVMYAFYKNIVYVLGNVYLAFYSGFSAQSLHTPAEISTFNLLWTTFPSLVFAILDKDTSDCTVENNPQLYKETQSDRRGQFFWCMLGWIAVAFWDSLVSFFFPFAVASHLQRSGETASIWSLGVTTYTMAIFTVSMKHFSRMHNLTLIHLGSYIFSTWLWIPVMCVLSSMYKNWKVLGDLSSIGHDLTRSATFWLLLLLCPVAAILPSGSLELFRTRYAPEDYEVMREIEHGWIDGFFFNDAPDFVENIPTIEPEVEVPKTKAGQVPSALHKEIADKRQAAINEVGTEAEPGEEKDDNDLDNTKPQETEEEDKELMQPRRLTWREVTNEDELEDLHLSDTLGRFGRRRSSGFQMTTRHSDQPDVPVPLVQGPTPPQRKSLIFESSDANPTLTLTQAKRNSIFGITVPSDQLPVPQIAEPATTVPVDQLPTAKGNARTTAGVSTGRDRKKRKDIKRTLDLSRLEATPIDRIKSRTESLKPDSSSRRVVAHAPRSSALHLRPSRYVDPGNSQNGSSRSTSPRGENSPLSKGSLFRKPSYETPPHSPRKSQTRRSVHPSRLN